jgi:alkaline phosphatase D
MKTHNLVLLLSFVFILFSCKKDGVNRDPNRTLNRICFGSCSTQHLDNHGIFNYIRAQKPDLYIAGGDNIYGDFFAILPGTKDYMIQAYRNQWNKEPLRRLYENVETIATWDDHDFGQNDGVIDNTAKHYAKELFFEYFKIPADHPRRFNPSGAIYAVQEYGDADHKVQVLLLDLRWAHTPYKVGGAAGALSGYDTIMDSNARMMSDEQWAWLKTQLEKPAKLRIVMSSLQFSASYNGGEAWNVLPLEQQRMIDLIKTTRANGVVFISGDVHFGDANVMRPADCYPLYDFTSSGLTHSSDAYNSVNRVSGIGAPYTGLNFGQIDIDWNNSNVTFSINNNVAQSKIKKTIPFSELKF